MKINWEVIDWRRGWTKNKRLSGIIEDVCPHAVGHYVGVHGCDGCCSGLYGSTKKTNGDEIILYKPSFTSTSKLIKLIRSIPGYAGPDGVNKFIDQAVNEKLKRDGLLKK